MKIAVLKERRANEARVAASPDTVKKMVGLGLAVTVESGAGAGASIPDQSFADAGAEIARDAAAATSAADIVVKVQRPVGPGEAGPNELALMRQGHELIGLLASY